VGVPSFNLNGRVTVLLLGKTPQFKDFRKILGKKANLVKDFRKILSKKANLVKILSKKANLVEDWFSRVTVRLLIFA